MAHFVGQTLQYAIGAIDAYILHLNGHKTRVDTRFLWHKPLMHFSRKENNRDCRLSFYEIGTFKLSLSNCPKKLEIFFFNLFIFLSPNLQIKVIKIQFNLREI